MMNVRKPPVLFTFIGVILVGAGVASAQNTALVIGNSDYPGTDNDLPGVAIDVLQKDNALQNAGWTTVLAQDETAEGMIAAITGNIPPGTKQYIVWYAGHGVCGNGDLVGVDDQVVNPQDLVDALDADAGRTLVILDSCYGGNFANNVNAINPAPGFITAGSKAESVLGSDFGGKFTKCFVGGLNGAADAVANGGNGDGDVTVSEAAAYATNNCVFEGQTPAWDGDDGAWVIGAAAGKCTVKCKDTEVEVSAQPDAGTCNSHCDTFCATHGGIFTCSFEGEQIKGNCDVFCKNGSSNHVTLSNPTEADCISACQTFCGDPDAVESCYLKGQNIKGNCDVLCKDETTSHVSVPDEGTCLNQCQTFCGDPDAVETCLFKGLNIKGNCDVECKDATTSHVSMPDRKACWDYCADTCTDFDLVHMCQFKGEKLYSNIPAVSTWGLLVLLLLVAAAGTLVIRRSRALA